MRFAFDKTDGLLPVDFTEGGKVVKTIDFQIGPWVERVDAVMVPYWERPPHLQNGDCYAKIALWLTAAGAPAMAAPETLAVVFVNELYKASAALKKKLESSSGTADGSEAPSNPPAPPSLPPSEPAPATSTPTS